MCFGFGVRRGRRIHDLDGVAIDHLEDGHWADLDGGERSGSEEERKPIEHAAKRARGRPHERAEVNLASQGRQFTYACAPRPALPPAGTAEVASSARPFLLHVVQVLLQRLAQAITEDAVKRGHPPADCGR